MQRFVLLLTPFALLACSPAAPGASNASGADASMARDVSGPADTSECPCPGSLVCESGFCVRPAADVVGSEGVSPSRDTSKQTDVSTSSQDVTADTERDTMRADAGEIDAGCECSNADAGCCDGCHLLPEGRTCASDGYEEHCRNAGKPGGCGDNYERIREVAECDGETPTCPEMSKKIVDREECSNSEICRSTGCEKSRRRCP